MDTVVDVVGNSMVVVGSVVSAMRRKINLWFFFLFKLDSNEMMKKQIARSRVRILAVHASEKQRA
jgi:hypothetical protein